MDFGFKGEVPGARGILNSEIGMRNAGVGTIQFRNSGIKIVN